MEQGTASAFSISSASFKNGDTLPNNQVHPMAGTGGKNYSPQLFWQGAPKETQSFAIVAHDPDAPKANGWYHWIVINIPPSTTSLKEHQQINSPMLEVKNDFGKVNYGGACPPKGHGVHHYNFTVYALNISKLIPDENQTPSSIMHAIEKHVVQSATITATYSRD